MANIQISSLTGPALDFAVAKAEQLSIVKDPMGFKDYSNQSGYWIWKIDTENNQIQTAKIIGVDYSPSLHHKDGSLIAELNFISRSVEINSNNEKYWVSTATGEDGKVIKTEGATSLIAAMRCFAILRLGESIDIPNYFFS